MAIITKIINGKKYLYERVYKNGKQQWKVLGHYDGNGNFIPSKKMRGKKPEDFPAEIQRVTTTTTKIRVVEKKEEKSEKEAIEPEIAKPSPQFTMMRNGTATNELMKTPSKEKLQENFDFISNIAIFKQNNFLATFENFSEIKGLRNSTKKLLDALMIKFTEGTGKNPIVNLPLAEYMKMRGLKDEKEARKQAKEDLETLSKIKLTFSQEIKGKPNDFMDLKIIGTKGIKNGIISAAFDIAFYALILNYQVMPMPLALLALNDKHSPNAYPLGRRILIHKNINRVNMTGNEDIISVQTLLEACPDIPTKEELAQTNRLYKQLIIEPFELGMNTLEGTGLLSWEYCHSKGEPLTDSELENLNYETFINLLVKITWNNYPELPMKEKPRKTSPKIRKTKN